MEKNLLLEVAYLGTPYFGFQIQNKKNASEITVQHILEEALQRLFKKKVRIIYASRTDRGVHAHAQTVNFKVKTTIPLANIKRALNAYLPSDIRIKKTHKVPLSFHSRFWAHSKVYRYIILNKKEFSVFFKDFVWHISSRLDIKSMKKAADALIGEKDFSLFAKETKKYNNSHRRINGIVFRKRNSFLYIDIEADGFLRNMARNIISFLVRVGEGKISLSHVQDIVSGQRPYVNKPAPPQGLYLLKVNYSPSSS